MNDLLGHAGLTLLFACIPLALPGMRRTPIALRLVLVFLCGVLLYAPILEGRTLIFTLRGFMGDLSLATCVLLLFEYAKRLGVRSPWTAPCPRDVALILAGLLLGLYLCTLSYIQYDLYAWGYRPNGILIGVGVLLAYAWQRHPCLAVAWLIGLAGFALEIGPSINLWDFLGDPILCLGGIWRAIVAEKAQPETVTLPQLRLAA